MDLPGPWALCVQSVLLVRWVPLDLPDQLVPWVLCARSVLWTPWTPLDLPDQSAPSALSVPSAPWDPLVRALQLVRWLLSVR